MPGIPQSGGEDAEMQPARATAFSSGDAHGTQGPLGALRERLAAGTMALTKRIDPRGCRRRSALRNRSRPGSSPAASAAPFRPSSRGEVREHLDEILGRLSREWLTDRYRPGDHPPRVDSQVGDGSGSLASGCDHLAVPRPLAGTMQQVHNVSATAFRHPPPENASP
jgi:hypothetical protein